MKAEHIKIVKTIAITWSGLIILFIISRSYQIQHNVSASMPQAWWVTEVGNNDVHVGDYVIVRFHNKHMIHHDDYEFVVKQVGGIGGDKITVKKWVGLQEGVTPPNKTSLLYILNDKFYPVFDRLSVNELEPLTRHGMVIPSGYYFIHGQHNPTFDSRYKDFGLISTSQIYGKTHPIF